ncbi:MAG: hypothetical protein KF832_27355 [Caldilineaceae bacterium]|nr:hypothetical protein [Caldilineaceae bacterium]
MGTIAPTPRMLPPLPTATLTRTATGTTYVSVAASNRVVVATFHDSSGASLLSSAVPVAATALTPTATAPYTIPVPRRALVYEYAIVQTQG